MNRVVRVFMTDKRKQLADAIWNYGQENGFEDMAGVCARSLIGLAHATGGKEIEFTCDLGKVNVFPEAIPESQKH